MNVSDYDSENYSSDEDEDYVPSGEDDSEDDGKDLVPEDDIDGDDQEIPQDDDDGGKMTSNKNKSTKKRKKRRMGVTLNKSEDEHNSEEVTDSKKSEHNIKKETVNEQSRADSLWASFLSDVTPRPKPTNTTAPHTLMADQIIPDQHQEVNKTKEVQKEPSKITITKVFDFAGEEVRVSKEVDSYSKEAKSFIKKLEEDSGKEPNTEETNVSSYSGACSSGYMERKAFLERVDQRQFEIEKSIRLSNMKR
ncbi:CFDP1 protein, partial [Polypterus senegalus]